MPEGKIFKELPEDCLLNISLFLLGTPQQWRLHSSKALRRIQKSFIPTVITKSSKIDYDSGEDEMLDTFLNYSSFAPFVSNSTWDSYFLFVEASVQLSDYRFRAPWHRPRGTNLKVSSPLAPLKCPLALQPSQAIKGDEPVLFNFVFETMLPFAVLGAHAVEGDES